MNIICCIRLKIQFLVACSGLFWYKMQNRWAVRYVGCVFYLLFFIIFCVYIMGYKIWYIEEFFLEGQYKNKDCSLSCLWDQPHIFEIYERCECALSRVYNYYFKTLGVALQKDCFLFAPLCLKRAAHESCHK